MKNPILRFNPILVLLITFLLTSIFWWLRIGPIALILFLCGIQISLALLFYHTWTYIKSRQYVKLLLMYIYFIGFGSAYMFHALKAVEAELSKLWYPGYRGTFTMEESKADSQIGRAHV